MLPHIARLASLRGRVVDVENLAQCRCGPPAAEEWKICYRWHRPAAHLPFIGGRKRLPCHVICPKKWTSGHVIKLLLVKLRDVVKIRARFAMQNTDNQLFRSDIPGPHKSFVARKPRTKERGYPSNH
ncbi:hypothetical protein H2Z84_10035 [Aquitalea magnusonii]|uniref:Uncharacterized protein n=1 Tax=Aquitalea aquatica TaxID=3044273 RepID=A0A838XZU3_9NEIS|nr:hypothetical protein [Aquitalea magnusonii]